MIAQRSDVASHQYFYVNVLRTVATKGSISGSMRLGAMACRSRSRSRSTSHDSLSRTTLCFGSPFTNLSDSQHTVPSSPEPVRGGRAEGLRLGKRGRGGQKEGEGKYKSDG